MENSKDSLRNDIIESLEDQGFLVNPHLRIEGNGKDTIRKVHEQKRAELIRAHRSFLLANFEKVKEYALDGIKLNPNKISLELVEVKPRSFESTLFLWWNLVWWSLPYDKPIGRQLRFILWDRQHDAPFGLIGLQSPPLRSAARDSYLGLQKGNVDYWINQSMYAQRVGALPPYNALLGAKMVALSLTCNEIRECYKKKYKNEVSLLKHRTIPSNLLFITTTSAYGKSSIYERIRYQGDNVSQFIGFTAGSGTFHIPQSLYEKILLFLKKEGYDTRRGYGTGPSRKLKLISQAFKKLGLDGFAFHNIKRGHYIFPNVLNLKKIINENRRPEWYDRPFEVLCNFWKQRWCIPRSHRMMNWKQFDSDDYFRNVKNLLTSLA
jgi:hypothetical protein